MKVSDNARIWLMIVLLPALAISLGIGAILFQRATMRLHEQVIDLNNEVDRAYERMGGKVDTSSDALLKQLDDTSKLLDEIERKIDALDKKEQEFNRRADELNRQLDAMGGKR